MKEGFIEKYDNAVPDDICDSLIALINREEAIGSGRAYLTKKNQEVEKKVNEVRTILDKKDETSPYVSAIDMALLELNYTHEGLILDLDHIAKHYIFEYNKKYMVWSSELNMDLIPSDSVELVKKNAEDVDLLNDIICRHGYWQIKKYRHPDDGYYAWHTDWGPMSEWIERQLAVFIYLNDVDEGGETEFYFQKLKVKPKKGTMVIWPVSFTHTHKGNNPISNDKYVIQAWYKVKNLFE